MTTAFVCYLALACLICWRPNRRDPLPERFEADDGAVHPLRLRNDLRWLAERTQLDRIGLAEVLLIGANVALVIGVWNWLASEGYVGRY